MFPFRVFMFSFVYLIYDLDFQSNRTTNGRYVNYEMRESV